MFQISRRKFFGLFGGAVAAAAAPKPLMALVPSMVVPVSTAGNITYKMLQDAFAQTTFPTPPSHFRYVHYRGKADPDGFFHPGQLVYWCRPNVSVSKNPRGGGNSWRPIAGMMVGPIAPDHHGWIQIKS